MFSELTKHPDFLSPQSFAWCNELAARTGKYEFTWIGVVEGDSGEDVLTKKLAAVIGGKVLDVGCGHGEYTNRWAAFAEEIVGLDVTAGFLETANLHRKPNVRYVRGDTHHSLPFADDAFDMAYTKKGPGSWYTEGNRVVRPGGKVILYHPGDGNGEGGELGLCFPGLFQSPTVGTPILDKVQERLETSGLVDIHMERIREIVWIPSAADVLNMLCFGQRESYSEYVRETCYAGIVSQFDKHATARGIRTTGFYYLIEAAASR
ncbi:class I SAM-dependent methyltransferase [Paenibacillus sp. BC26]|uniref:class I SAM-dependent methyltransferase n=1 Tax=Paenibacillus sp. BC26 TaxID=1881032 RepID=UPI0008EA38B2|nr:class I SAM-dependent methyltransferase [Paenibacillus sp. BC26]SFS69667.1 Methyltransferase domain-containing protein [Paenibacillus sp. BC26]